MLVLLGLVNMVEFRLALPVVVWLWLSGVVGLWLPGVREL